MSRWQRLCSIAVPISVAIGLVLGFLPRNWIEVRLGFDPDGGSGLLELLLILIPAAIAVCIAIYVYKPQWGAQPNEEVAPASPLRN